MERVLVVGKSFATEALRFPEPLPLALVTIRSAVTELSTLPVADFLADAPNTEMADTKQHPEGAIVVLTTYDDDVSVLAALGASACSYLTKDADRVDIANALRSAATGLAVLDPTIQATLVAAATRPAPPAEHRQSLPGELPDGLTRREAEMARGMSNPDIAGELYLSAHTVKSHIKPDLLEDWLPRPGGRRALRPPAPPRVTRRR